MTNRDIVAAWVEGYHRAWRSNDPADIRAIFTDDAVYSRGAHVAEPYVGVDAIVVAWLEHQDEPGTWTSQWSIVAVDGDTAVVRCETTYPHEVYDNLWVIRLAEDGRASEFTDWWVERR